MFPGKGERVMGRSLHNRIRLKGSRLPLLNTDRLRSVAVKASASIGLLILAVKSFK
jgi:hypothetical protein